MSSLYKEAISTKIGGTTISIETSHSKTLSSYQSFFEWLKDESVFLYTQNMNKEVITIKIGSNALLGESGKNFDTDIITHLLDDIYKWRKQYHIVLVSSGAVAAGRIVLQKTADTLDRSTLAAVGQMHLIDMYYRLCVERDIVPSQILISREHLTVRENYAHIRHTFQELLHHDIFPIVNENDAVALQGGGFGDNDALAVYAAILSRSDRLIFLTNLDGLYTADPRVDANAEFLERVDNIDQEITAMCSASRSSFGTGGMLSKLRSAKMATTAGIDVHIINGLKTENLSQLLSGEKVGTWFPRIGEDSLSDKKLWLLLGSTSNGQIIVDDGAKEALKQRKSLLAVGIKKVRGKFVQKDFVNILDMQGDTIALGIVDYDSEILSEALKQKKDKESIRRRLPREVVHSDNITLLK
ncbi:MAG: Glutamate 5-kinase [Parcubacteria group bacterium GW2011_GWA2_43_13]|nr:MAG: Glutamate 5-kinase [Parcubacteria group bacterium GW2011_GWA2_43_13]